MLCLRPGDRGSLKTVHTASTGPPHAAPAGAICVGHDTGGLGKVSLGVSRPQLAAPAARPAPGHQGLLPRTLRQPCPALPHPPCLAQMPGIYFKAQATHLPHWAAHLSAAVGDAARLPATARREMVADALSRRFPADVMMTQYASAWAKVGPRGVGPGG